MLANALLTLYRSLTRHRLYAALNVFGLAVGVAVFLVLTLDVRFETSFERWIPHADQIYVVRSVWQVPGSGGANNSTMGGTLDELRGDYPQLLGARIWDQRAVVRHGASVTASHLVLVDPSFFKVFDLPLIAGDKSTGLASPTNILLTQSEARRDFGSADPLGRRLTIDYGDATHVYKVVGVVKDLPKATDLDFDMLAPLTPEMTQAQGWRHWGTETLRTYLRFDRPDQARALDANLDAFVDRHAMTDMPPPPLPHKQLTLHVQPLTSLHLIDPTDRATVAALGAVGVLTLLLAAVNYVNLATARAGLRAREVALRKVMGATGGTLVAQFMAEAIATAAVAAAIGLALCELALPAVNAVGGSSLRIDYLGGDGVLPLLALVVLAVGAGAGVYPALVLSRFRPAAVLASARTPGGGRAGMRVREALVVFQFAVAIAFTVATGVILAETHYLRTADLGFRRHGLVIVNSFDNSGVSAAQRSSLLSAWRALPGVVGATSGDLAPGTIDSRDVEAFKRPGLPSPPQGLPLAQVSTSPDFFRIYGARLLAGRLLDLAHGGDDAPPPLGPGLDAPLSSTPHDVVVNARALRTLGFSDAAGAVGRTIYKMRNNGGLDALTIVGVVDDFRFISPRDPTDATVYFLHTQDFPSRIAAVRYDAADPRQVIDRLQTVWRQIAPNTPFRARTVEDNLQLYYRPDDQHGGLFSAGAVLAVLIGCVGLYGLASFTTARRTKEIGIRKTLGASTGDVLRLLVGQFLRPVLIANLIAWPLAWLAMHSYLAGFYQRVALSPLYFLAATALALLIAGLTVIGQALRVARAEPARALRYE